MAPYTQLEKGVILDVKDREEFVEYIMENAHDPGFQMENWGSNMAPVEIVVKNYNNDDGDNPFYDTFDVHRNGNVTRNSWNAVLIEDMREENILEFEESRIDRVKNLERRFE